MKVDKIKKMKVCLLCGGRSAEHEVSLQSAKNVFNEMDRTKFEPFVVGIDKSGRWFLYEQGSFLENPDDPKTVCLAGGGEPLALVPGERKFTGLENRREYGFDVVFPVLHGTFGEDGTVQGLLELLDVPFAGSGTTGAAVGMDKDIMKRLFRESGIPAGKFIVIYSEKEIPSYNKVREKLKVPLFIKPANMGSSVGVNKAHNEEEYYRFVKEAFKYDTKILLEENIEGREIECAVLGNKDVIVSLPGEIKPNHEFYSYEAKYLDENGAKLEIPAKLEEKELKTIQSLAVKTFKTLCCEGLSRVDFFISNAGEVYVNEINTIPGFTKISMYPKLFEISGIKYPELITRLIELAVESYESRKKLVRVCGII